MILEEPKRVDMRDFTVTGTEEELVARGYAAPECGAVGCIAGWGAILLRLEQRPHLKTFRAAVDYSNFRGGTPEVACEFFDIDPGIGDSLFYEEHWPQDLYDALREESAGTADYAQVVATAIDRFIACGGNWAADDGPTVTVSEAAG